MISDMKNFDSTWTSIKFYASHHGSISTLDKRIVNEIVQTTDEAIVVVSQASKHSNQRRLTRKDFLFAWDCLVSSKSLTLKDIDPRLRGRRAIIFAFLSKLPDVNCTLNPLTLHLKK